MKAVALSPLPAPFGLRDPCNITIAGGVCDAFLDGREATHGGGLAAVGVRDVPDPRAVLDR